MYLLDSAFFIVLVKQVCYIPLEGPALIFSHPLYICSVVTNCLILSHIKC